MKKIKKVENVVERILDVREDTRGNDDLLYLCVCEQFNEAIPLMTVGDFLNLRKNIGCPDFETVTRTRRKIFERRPELKPQKITQIREERVDVFVDYALNG